MESQPQMTVDVADNSVDQISETPFELNLGHFLYRGFELAFAASILLLTLPIILLIALLIRRGSPGPVLFFQERVGKGGKTFRFVKFRTMYADAKQRFPDLYR